MDQHLETQALVLEGRWGGGNGKGYLHGGSGGHQEGRGVNLANWGDGHTYWDGHQSNKGRAWTSDSN